MGQQKTTGALYATLSSEHESFVALIDQGLEATDPMKRRKTLEELRVEWLSHCRAVDRTFHASLLHFDETWTYSQQAKTEQDDIARLVEAALESKAGSEKQQSCLQSLRRAAVQHIEKEEVEVFNQAHRFLPKLQEENLRNRFGEAKKLYRERLQSDARAPTTAFRERRFGESTVPQCCQSATERSG